MPLLNVLQALGRKRVERVSRSSEDEDRMLPLFLEREAGSELLPVLCQDAEA